MRGLLDLTVGKEMRCIGAVVAAVVAADADADVVETVADAEAGTGAVEPRCRDQAGGFGGVASVGLTVVHAAGGGERDEGHLGVADEDVETAGPGEAVAVGMVQ